MKIPFYKIQGAGNDCIVFHGKDMVDGGPARKKTFVQKISHRNLGIGADQVLEILNLAPLAIQVWNCDGTKAEMCGNGARSFAMLAQHQGWIQEGAERVPLEISGRPYFLQKNGAAYEVSLGKPQTSAARTLSLKGKKIPYIPVDVGNPHAVIFMQARGTWAAPKDFDYRVYGAAIEVHRHFPHKANVEFVRAVTKTKAGIELRVEAWERGAGATMSCGSGAVAVAAAYREKYAPEAKALRVRMKKFVLTVRFEGAEAFLSGPSEIVAEGVFFSA